jgi:hypothetical protein
MVNNDNDVNKSMMNETVENIPLWCSLFNKISLGFSYFKVYRSVSRMKLRKSFFRKYSVIYIIYEKIDKKLYARWVSEWVSEWVMWSEVSRSIICTVCTWSVLHTVASGLFKCAFGIIYSEELIDSISSCVFLTENL